MKNIENHAVIQGAQSSTALTAQNYFYPTMGPPRMRGAMVTAKF